MAKKKDKKEEKKPVIKTARCNLCSGTGQRKSMTGVGWNSDFYETCYNCKGRGTYQYEVKKKGCFVATAVYGSEFSPEVVTLRQYRDDILLHNSFGQKFVDFYYKFSPPLATWLENKLLLKRTVKKGLDIFVNTIVKKSLQRTKDKP